MIEAELRAKALIEIKRIVDKDKNGEKFTILTEENRKNIEFMREYGLNLNDVKDIVRGLSVEDCFSGPEFNRNPEFGGWVYKFSPMFEDVKLYIKINIITKENATCISVHEFGKYDGVN